MDETGGAESSPTKRRRVVGRGHTLDAIPATQWGTWGSPETKEHTTLSVPTHGEAAFPPAGQDAGSPDLASPQAPPIS